MGGVGLVRDQDRQGGLGRVMITYKGFLGRLSRTPRNWVLMEKGEIRFGAGVNCPTTYLNRKRPIINAATTEDFNTPDIWAAADNESGHNPSIRKDLLKACGLKETK